MAIARPGGGSQEFKLKIGGDHYPGKADRGNEMSLNENARRTQKTSIDWKKTPYDRTAGHGPNNISKYDIQLDVSEI